MIKTLKVISLTLSLAALCSVSSVSFAKGDRFTKIDLDADGQITLEEYTQSSKKPEKAEKRFNKTDADGDGFISREELEAAKKNKKKKK